MNEEISTGVMPSILDRISEREVCNWMIAKMEQLRAGSIPGLHYIDLSVHENGREPYCSWGAQGCGECAVSHKTLDEAAKQLRDDIMDSPASKASAKRRAAKSLMEEAEQLEKIAATI